MIEIVIPVLWGALAYLAGSINWGLFVSRKYGVDILSVGNRNPGAANVYREVGRGPGLYVYVADMLTAALVVAPTRWLPSSDACMLAASVMVVVGTVFPVWSRLKGGTGLAKGTGVALGINPSGFLLGSLVGLFVLIKLRNPGWAGALAAGVTILTSAFLFNDWIGLSAISSAGALIFLRSGVQYRGRRTR